MLKKLGHVFDTLVFMKIIVCHHFVVLCMMVNPRPSLRALHLLIVSGLEGTPTLTRNVLRLLWCPCYKTPIDLIYSNTSMVTPF